MLVYPQQRVAAGHADGGRHEAEVGGRLDVTLRLLSMVRAPHSLCLCFCWRPKSLALSLPCWVFFVHV